MESEKQKAQFWAASLLMKYVILVIIKKSMKIG